MDLVGNIFGRTHEPNLEITRFGYRIGVEYSSIAATEPIQAERNPHWSTILNIRAAKKFQLRSSRPSPLPQVWQFRCAPLLIGLE
jgi:hypothetical protein